MKMVCLDVEGVLFPEVWQAIAVETGITSLELTTRDEPDYNKLMAGRITALNIEGIKFDDLIACATHVEPLPGAAGDSFNDIGMLDAANCSAFIHAPEHISALRPNIPACKEYKELAYFINQENWYRTH